MTKESKSCQKLAPIFFAPGPTLSHKNIENKEPYGDGGAMTLCDTVSFKGFLCLYEKFPPFFCVVHLFIFFVDNPIFSQYFCAFLNRYLYHFWLYGNYCIPDSINVFVYLFLSLTVFWYFVATLSLGVHVLPAIKLFYVFDKIPKYRETNVQDF